MDEHNRYREEELEEEQDKAEAKPADKATTEAKDANETDAEETAGEDTITSDAEPDELEIQKQEVARLTDLLLRNAAELDNFKKRTNEERIRDRKYALESFLRELIDVLDIFDAAVNFNTDDTKLQNFLIGFKMVNDRFKSILGNEGVVKIDALGKKFDPSFHHALGKSHDLDKEEGMVTEVMMSGYMYKDRVLRPAMVKVNTHEPEPIENSNDKEDK